MSDTNTLETVLATATENALAGGLTPEARVSLYSLALSMAADEFFLIEAEHPGTVSAEVLIALHQISTICQPNLTEDMVMESMTVIADILQGAPNGQEEEPNDGGSIIIAR